jgi:LacI family transcriptional regulator
VSNTTVSNVIHGRVNRVSQKTIDTINKIIDETGYTPNLSARALVAGSSRVIALVNHLAPQRSGYFMADPYQDIIIGSIEDVMRASGYYLMLRTVSGADELITFARNWNVEGLFLTGVFDGGQIHKALLRLKIPVVLSDSYLNDYSHMVNVGLEDERGGYLATKHLIDNGHRSIAFASPSISGGGVVWQRLLGYKRALAEAGIPFDNALVFESEFSTHATEELGIALAARFDITAVFATADIMAAGIMAGLQQCGRMVPRDISVIGFDDINWCRLTMPMLTTIRQDAHKKGEIAAQCMLRLLGGKTVEQRNCILPVQLKIRESVAKLENRE